MREFNTIFKNLKKEFGDYVVLDENFRSNNKGYYYVKCIEFKDNKFQVLLLVNNSIILYNYTINTFGFIYYDKPLPKFKKENIIILSKKNMIKPRGIPTLFGVSVETEDFKEFKYYIHLGHSLESIKEQCEHEIFKELVKSFIFKDEPQIIDYIQDENFNIGKLF